jgi:hypothetical protein
MGARTLARRSVRLREVWSRRLRLDVSRSHPWQFAWAASARRCRSCGELGFLPGDVTADHITGVYKAKLDQRCGGEDGGAAVVAKEEELPVKTADVWVSPGTVRVEPPFEHGARDVEGAGNDAVALSVTGGSDVDDQCAAVGRREGIDRLEPADPCLRRLEQCVERAPSLWNAHALIIRWTSCAVQRLLSTAHPRSVVSSALEVDELPESGSFSGGKLEAM